MFTTSTQSVFLSHIVAACFLPCLGFGQATDPAPPVALEERKTGVQRFINSDIVKISGLVDAYYSLNFNHPATINNNLRNFDVQANRPALNMAKLSFEHAPAPVGGKIEFLFGRAGRVFHATEPSGSELSRYLLQAYVSVKPPAWNGLQIDFGKFVTSAGGEVTETHLNWNYSRAFLFANGPYYHVGLRATKPITKVWTTGVQVVNGWNNWKDNNNGKTLGITNAFTGSKVSLFNTYYVGPEKNGTNSGWRHFVDTVLLLTPTAKTSYYINYDYGTDRRIGGGENRFTGIAGAARFQTSTHTAIATRAEWYRDRDGFITGVAQNLKEVTVTGEYKFNPEVLLRLEYRRDWSNQAYFDRGNEPGSYKNQNTLLLGMVVYIGPR